MLFTYRAIDQDGHDREGTIEALSQEVAVTALQRRGLVISSIKSGENVNPLNFEINIFTSIKHKDVVILSRQVSTLFEAQVSALRVFRLLAGEVNNHRLAGILSQIADDIQGGSPISKALSKHPGAFSPFYVNMVRAGEESGKLSETFIYLADYLDRSYEVMTKAKNALIYPAFVISVFIAVMVLMLTYVVPQISGILLDSGQELPIYTIIVIGISDFLVNYGIILFFGLIGLGIYGYNLTRTPEGRFILDSLELGIPFIGDLYQKMFLSRIADNFSTMLVSGVPVIESLDITASVVGNGVYERVLKDVAATVKGGSPISEALSHHPQIPGIMVAMVKVGEETGEMGKILGTLAKFYNREVSNAVDTLVGLIEPIMIVALGLGVGTLLAAILMPIYNLANTF